MSNLYATKKERLIREISRAKDEIRLGKDTTNLFRQRTPTSHRTVNVRDFHEVLEINTREGWVEVEGMCTYAELVDATLPHGVMPAVVPELKSITVGGAVSGVGLESSSYRHGFVHQTVLEIEVLLSTGDVVTCTPYNEYQDLFFGFPNSYGTLGYILKLKLKIVPVKPYVHITHRKFEDTQEFFRAIQDHCNQNKADFIEGVVFSEKEHVMSTGSFVESAPYVSDYTYMNIYFRSLRKRKEDFLTVRDYFWRWDTDWFWCSRLLYAQNPLIRLALGRKRLNSVFYMRVIQWNQKVGFMSFLQKLFRLQSESVIQDIEVPIESAATFLRFFHTEIGILPVIIGPVKNPVPSRRYPLFPLDPHVLYVNIGFWSPVNVPWGSPPGMLNKKIEKIAAELGGYKMLYSDSFYTEQELWEHADKTVYDDLKRRYDPDGRLKTLYEKCVLKA